MSTHNASIYGDCADYKVRDGLALSHAKIALGV